MSRTAAVATKQDLARTEKALRLVYGVLVPRMNYRETRLGYARAQHERLFVRTEAIFRQMEKELGEDWRQLLAACEKDADAGLRLERRHMEDAAEEILAVINKLLPPVQDVIVRRAMGMSWWRIFAALPERAKFSLTDDHAAGLQKIWIDGQDAVRRLV